MAMYYCESCGGLLDDDYEPCTDIAGMDMVCPNCALEIEAEQEEEKKNA